MFNQGLDQTDARLAASGPQAQISPTAPLTYNATTGVVALPQASATVNGYLASGDWSAFNAKEPAISLGTSLQYWRGDKTWQTLKRHGWTNFLPEHCQFQRNRDFVWGFVFSR